jgi:hypothetical protein
MGACWKTRHKCGQGLKNPRKKNDCGWCNRKDGYDRIECTLIDHEGNSLAVDHMIVSCEADYCPVCGRRMPSEQTGT